MRGRGREREGAADSAEQRGGKPPPEEFAAFHVCQPGAGSQQVLPGALEDVD